MQTQVASHPIVVALLAVSLTSGAACGGSSSAAAPPAASAASQPKPLPVPEPAPKTPALSALEQGRALTAQFYERKTAELWPQLSSEMQSTLGSQEKFAAIREEVDGQLGAETKVLDESVANSPPYQVYLRTASFSKTEQPVILQWALASDGKVAGFVIKPRPNELHGAAAQAVLERGQSFTAQFYQGKTAELWPRMSGEMQGMLGSQEKFAAFRQQVEEQLGTETKLLEEKVAEAPPYQVYVRKAEFSKIQGEVILQWAFEANGTIAGFLIRPGS